MESIAKQHTRIGSNITSNLVDLDEYMNSFGKCPNERTKCNLSIPCHPDQFQGYMYMNEFENHTPEISEISKCGIKYNRCTCLTLKLI